MSDSKEDIKFHHVGIVVNSDAIRNLLNSFFGELKGPTWYNENQGVDVTFLPLGGAFLELIYPHGNETIERFLKKRGEGIHHFCFEVKDLDKWAKKCEKMGFKVVSRDHRCFFIHPKSFGGILIEFVGYLEHDQMKEISIIEE